MLACMNPKLCCLATIHYDTSFFSAKQHTRHCVVLGDELTPHPVMVEIVLQPETGVEKKVLDIGQSPSVVPQKNLIKLPLDSPFRVWEWHMVSTRPFDTICDLLLC